MEKGHNSKSVWIAGIARGHNSGVCLLKDGEVVFAKSADEFEELIRHYLRHPEERIPHIKKGCYRAMKLYSQDYKNNLFFIDVSG